MASLHLLPYCTQSHTFSNVEMPYLILMLLPVQLHWSPVPHITMSRHQAGESVAINDNSQI